MRGNTLAPQDALPLSWAPCVQVALSGTTRKQFRQSFNAPSCEIWLFRTKFSAQAIAKSASSQGTTRIPTTRLITDHRPFPALPRKPALCTRAGPGPVPAPAPAPVLRSLFPPSPVLREGHLQVSPLHSVAFQLYGKPNGQPALVLHGGPGAGSFPRHAQFFDPGHWMVVLLDQRGCGKSTPRGSLDGNTTQALVSDVELLRTHLGVDKWTLLGGSWGVTLALAYAQAFPQNVSGLILRGVCLMRRRDISWLYRPAGGLDSLMPIAWRDFNSHLTPEERHDPVGAYYRRLTSADDVTRDQAASAWVRLEMSAMFSGPSSGAAGHSVLSWDGAKYEQDGKPVTHLKPPAREPQVGPRTAEPSLQLDTLTGDSPSLSVHASPSHVPVTELGPRKGDTADCETKLKSEERARGGGGDVVSAPGGQLDERGKGKTPSHDRAVSVSPEVSVDSSSSSLSSNSGSSSSTFSSPPAESLRGSSGGVEMPSTVVQARIECHYAHHAAFLADNELLLNVPTIRHIRTRLVHGRWDLVCPVKCAFDLHEAWPEAQLRIVARSGHSMYDPGIQHELILATEAFKQAPQT